jgi:hypothetical protein
LHLLHLLNFEDEGGGNSSALNFYMEIAMTDLDKNRLSADADQLTTNFEEEFKVGMRRMWDDRRTRPLVQSLYQSEEELAYMASYLGYGCVRELGRFLMRHKLRLVITVGARYDCLPRLVFVIHDGPSACIAVCEFAVACIAQPEYAGSSLQAEADGWIHYDKAMKGFSNYCLAYLEWTASELGLQVHYSLTSAIVET